MVNHTGGRVGLKLLPLPRVPMGSWTTLALPLPLSRAGPEAESEETMTRLLASSEVLLRLRWTIGAGLADLGLTADAVPSTFCSGREEGPAVAEVAASPTVT